LIYTAGFQQTGKTEEQTVGLWVFFASLVKILLSKAYLFTHASQLDFHHYFECREC
jgi:hypothetical protein